MTHTRDIVEVVIAVRPTILVLYCRKRVDVGDSLECPEKLWTPSPMKRWKAIAIHEDTPTLYFTVWTLDVACS